MSPEYGSTCAIFPIDEETLRYLALQRTPRGADRSRGGLREGAGPLARRARRQPTFSDHLELDLSTVVPSIAGPKRPQDRVALSASKGSFREALKSYVPAQRDDAIAASFPASDPVATHVPNGGPAHRITPVTLADGTQTELDHGHVVIAAITSCTNTSNPSVMLGAGLLARNAVERGLTVRPWVKTSLAPGSKVVTEYLDRAGLTSYLDQLGFNLVGYGCTTCIGNSGPLPEAISRAVGDEASPSCRSCRVTGTSRGGSTRT